MKLQKFYNHLRNSLVTLAILLFTSGATKAQPQEAAFRIGFYNLENLFHPSDDSLKADEEFTPQGSRYWSYYRYNKKLNQMAKVILSLGEWEPPAIMGLEEVENRQVLEDLIGTRVLEKISYRVVHYESPDRRGIDVALIYRLDKFRLIYSKPLPLKIAGDPAFKSRDMLYVKGVAGIEDTLHIIVCHWPSRYGGQAASEPKRIAAAETLHRFLDSLQTAHQQPNVIIGGDFNDEPANASLKLLCQAREGDSANLVNLMAEMDPNKGSHRHHGVWTYLDQIIVSRGLLITEKPRVKNDQAKVLSYDFLLEYDEKYPGYKPYRHFLGLRYHGGFSDHLPVYLDLKLSEY